MIGKDATDDVTKGVNLPIDQQVVSLGEITVEGRISKKGDGKTTENGVFSRVGVECLRNVLKMLLD